MCLVPKGFPSCSFVCLAFCVFPWVSSFVFHCFQYIPCFIPIVSFVRWVLLPECLHWCLIPTFVYQPFNMCKNSPVFPVSFVKKSAILCTCPLSLYPFRFWFFFLLLMFHYLFYHQPKESVSPFISQLASHVWVLTLHNMTNRQIIDNANIN